MGFMCTGVQIGRGHHWNYDKGDWKETKITPDLWEISYAVTKRRVGHAPTQRKHLVKFLREFIEQLEKKPIPLEFEYKGKKMTQIMQWFE